MSILSLFVSGAGRAIKSWKWILVIWLCILSLVSLLVLPFKTEVISILGTSMITEKLTEGIDIDVITDLGSNISTIISSLSASVFMLVIFSFLLNVFLNGGLFVNLKSMDKRFTSGQFFGSSGENFWSFLVITLVFTSIIFFLGVIIIGLPLLIATGSEFEGVSVNTARIAAVIFLLLLPILLLVADYSRAWQASSTESACFKAIGVGFRQTFKHFFLSYCVMVVILIIQFLFTWLAFSLISSMKSKTGGEIFLLFLISQFLFIIKVLLRTWRYGSVTALLEMQT
jgi:hypothetical protein